MTCVDQAGRGPGQRRIRAHAAGVGAGVAVADALEVLGGQQRHRRRPSVTTNSDTSGPARYSSITTRPQVGGVRERGVPVVGHDDALAGGEPVVLDHVGRAELVERRRDLRRRGADERAGGRHPGRRHDSLANAFDPSSCAAAADGPKHGMPFARTASATPATSGASGPTTTRSAPTSTASAATACRIGGVDRAQSARAAVPGLPGAQTDAVTAGSAARASASACSRPPRAEEEYAHRTTIAHGRYLVAHRSHRCRSASPARARRMIAARAAVDLAEEQRVRTTFSSRPGPTPTTRRGCRSSSMRSM